jgi:hypothetical protein
VIAGEMSQSFFVVMALHVSTGRARAVSVISHSMDLFDI